MRAFTSCPRFSRLEPHSTNDKPCCLIREFGMRIVAAKYRHSTQVGNWFVHDGIRTVSCLLHRRRTTCTLLCMLRVSPYVAAFAGNTHTPDTHTLTHTHTCTCSAQQRSMQSASSGPLFSPTHQSSSRLAGLHDRSPDFSAGSKKKPADSCPKPSNAVQQLAG